MSCVICYYSGGTAQTLDEAMIDGNEIIAKFDGATELPNHHRELICIAHSLPGVRIHVADDPKLTWRPSVLDYEAACRRYQYVRDIYVGVKVRTGTYMKYDPAQDCFVVSEVMSQYAQLPDPVPGKPEQTRYVHTDKSLWEMRPYAKIFKDRIEIIAGVHNNYLEMFGIHRRSSRTVKLSGSTWTYKDQVLNGDTPVILKDGVLTVVNPPKVRVMDSKKRNEMNRMIQSIRNLMKVRTKLGAFDRLTPTQVDEYMCQTSGGNKWRVLNSPAKFLELMQAVDPEDFKSFYPLLWLADKAWYYRDNNENFGRVDWVARYNNLVDSMREKMRRELGVVEYVEADERSADSPED